mmetsp:Transcript_69159/g.202985  ORF Transcript_69159/g.202985 Transcript_69159/m.202985 type:complete len:534 (-) Transcript_69159:185-1786(-)
MADVTMYAKPMSGTTAHAGLGSVVKLVTRQFLEQKHYRQLNKILAESWSNCHSLTAAVKLMEAHGVRIAPQEQQKFAEMPEDRMIEALVAKMPQQSREQFEHFFLQLSFIASTTTRLRGALENGDPAVVEESLDSAENVGVLPYLMKMAIAQAGQEVKTFASDHEAWLGETEGKISPLLQAASSLMSLQKELEGARSQLAQYQGEAKEKSKSMLLGMAGNNDQALLGTIVGGWGAFTARAKRELEIRAEYEAEIVESNRKLFEYKAAQMDKVKSVLARNSESAKGKLVMDCLAALRKETQVVRQKEELEAKMAEVDSKQKAYGDAAKAKGHAFLARMNAGTTEGLKQNTFAGFKLLVEMQKQEREEEVALKEAEEKLNEFMKKQNEGAKSVLNRMSSGTDSGLLQTIFQTWAEVVIEDKRAAEMEKAVAAKSAKFAMFNEKNKGSAMNAQEKNAWLQDQQLILALFNMWKREWKMETMRRYGKEKNDKRKKELIGVKGLFKDFASSLETTLQQGTPRVEDGKAKSRTRPLEGQ